MTVLRLVLLLVLLAGPAGACELPGNLAALRGALLERANAARAGAGLPGLAHDARLEAAAQAQACRLAGRGSMRLSHRGGWFAGLSRRLRREGYPHAIAVENLAAGQRDAAEAVAAWIASPQHRANLMEPRLTEAGFGVARAASGWLYWSMVGAARRAPE